VSDNAGRTNGVGSRFFSVLNVNGGGIAAPEEAPTPESLAAPSVCLADMIATLRA